MSESSKSSASASAQTLGIDQRLLDILVCPIDHAEVRVDGDHLTCTRCGRAYPVRDGIPEMIVREAGES